MTQRQRRAGPSTPSQTAWGLIGLLAGGDAADSSVTKAVGYLVKNQNGDGSWDEADFTGLISGVFYLKYHCIAIRSGLCVGAFSESGDQG